ncbi:MAG: helix-turn-helix domain-containing protein [Ruminococcaceae bacterium]|nr:helix-turn-helix domain-containing protein [Oscillospiraceae bacterium]
MEYLNIAEVAEKWGVSHRRLQTMCAAGKIKGATRFGKAWMIPKGTQKPIDGRTKAGKENSTTQLELDMPMPRKTPFLHMTDLYSEAGTAEKSISALGYNHEAQTLFAAEIAYSKGEIDKVYDSAYYLLHKHSGFYAVISAGMLLALCAIWRGDLNMWRQAKIHIAGAPAKSEAERDIMTFAITAIDSILYDVSSFPEWFKLGRFEPLHKDALPAAKVFYAKYLYAIGYALATKQFELQGVRGLSLMTMLPNAIEPMISQAVADNSIIAEIYLRMTCAAIYYTSGNKEQAVYHIDRAVVLALPDKLFGILAEYGRTLDSLLEQRISRVNTEAWHAVRDLYNIYMAGWTKLSGSVRGKNLATTLAPKEREVAKLAAFGFKNAQIADALNMSISAVKQAVTNVSNKTGMSRENFAAIL